jgi:flagellar biosynthesis protein FlhB
MSGGSDKTEKPTPKRLKEARWEGRVARSPDIGAWVAVGVAAILLPHTVSSAGANLQALMRRATTVIQDPEPAKALAFGAEGFHIIAATVLPFAAALAAIVFACAAAQGGLHIATKHMKPQFNRLNPMAGFKRMLGPNALWEGGKSLVKSVVVGVLLWRVVQDTAPALARSGELSLATTLTTVTQAVATLVRNAAFAGIVMGLADYGYQHRRLAKQLRMTLKEVKDEHKQSEGDPHVKGQIRSRQMAMSRNRMMAEVAKADVVLLNPTHVAVALRYDPAKGAPRVVAKGAGTVAARIREEADKHRIPMVQDIPLARALHSACDIGQEIPGDLYMAVARVLAFVMALKARGVAAGTHRVPEPALAGR